MKPRVLSTTPSLTAFPNLRLEVRADVIDEVFIDLDGVTADFEHEMNAGGHHADDFKLMPGSYLWLPPIKDALDSIHQLNKAFPARVWFLTKPPKFSPYAYVEKALWVQRYFGDDGLHQLIVTQNKSLVGTEKSILIDDRIHKGGVEQFRGTVIHFGAPINTEAQRSSIIPAIDWQSTHRIINELVERRK